MQSKLNGFHCGKCGVLNSEKHDYCYKCGNLLTFNNSQTKTTNSNSISAQQSESEFWNYFIFIAAIMLFFCVWVITKNVSSRVETNQSNSSNVEASSTSPDNKSGNVETITIKNKEIKVANVDEKHYFIFKVNAQKTIPNPLSETTADGVYLIIRIGVYNGSQSGGTFIPSLFKLVDDQNREFDGSSAGETALLMSGDKFASSSFEREINPGITTYLSLVFDIPDDAKIEFLKIPAGTFSSPDKDAYLPVPNPPYDPYAIPPNAG